MKTEWIIAGFFAAIIAGAIWGWLKIQKDERDGKA
jgi:hypothetical protein